MKKTYIVLGIIFIAMILFATYETGQKDGRIPHQSIIK